MLRFGDRLKINDNGKIINAVCIHPYINMWDRNNDMVTFLTATGVREFRIKMLRNDQLYGPIGNVFDDPVGEPFVWKSVRDPGPNTA
jgi:hypothetical protein